MATERDYRVVVDTDKNVIRVTMPLRPTLKRGGKNKQGKAILPIVELVDPVGAFVGEDTGVTFQGRPVRLKMSVYIPGVEADAESGIPVVNRGDRTGNADRANLKPLSFGGEDGAAPPDDDGADDAAPVSPPPQTVRGVPARKR